MSRPDTQTYVYPALTWKGRSEVGYPTMDEALSYASTNTTNGSVENSEVFGVLVQLRQTYGEQLKMIPQLSLSPNGLQTIARNWNAQQQKVEFTAEGDSQLFCIVRNHTNQVFRVNLLNISK